MKTKHLILQVIIVLFSSSLYAQSKNLNYKAIISENGNVLANHSVVVKFTIYDSSSTAIYEETHNTTSDANGIVSLSIGEGTTTDNFNTIDWNANLSLNVQINSGSGFVDMGTTPFQSVPYANFAHKASVADFVNNSFWHQIANGINSDNPVGIGVSSTVEANLHIKDVTNGQPLLKMESNDNIYTVWKSNRANVDDYLIGVDGGNNRFMIANTTSGNFPFSIKNDNVGINTLNPSANLHVNGTFRYQDGNQGVGKVLMSDANGNASWQSTTTNTYTLAYSPANVQPTANGDAFIRTQKEFYFASNSLKSFYIPVNLPVGSTITNIKYYYYDNSTSDLIFRLDFSNIPNGSSQNYYSTTAQTSGASTDVRVIEKNVNLPVTDNYNRAFYVVPTNGTWPGDNTLSFRSIVITYTR